MQIMIKARIADKIEKNIVLLICINMAAFNHNVHILSVSGTKSADFLHYNQIFGVTIIPFHCDIKNLIMMRKSRGLSDHNKLNMWTDNVITDITSPQSHSGVMSHKINLRNVSNVSVGPIAPLKEPCAGQAG